MSNSNARIDGPAPQGAALIIIDMINDLDFSGGDRIAPAANRAAQAILRLRDAADRRGTPVVYVNDNFGEWHSERSKLVERCTGSRGGDIGRRLAPRDDDYFVIKPQFSGFYATNLPVLLPKLGVTRLILTGLAADICVLFTAADAHMREYELWVPEDAVAGEDDRRARWALEIMDNSFGAEIATTEALAFDAWLDRGS